MQQTDASKDCSIDCREKQDVTSRQVQHFAGKLYKYCAKRVTHQEKGNKHWTSRYIFCILCIYVIQMLRTSNVQCCNFSHLYVTCLKRTREQPVLRLNSKKERGFMLGAYEQRSEVARLLAQISEEYEAAQRGMADLASGTAPNALTAQPKSIPARMENVGQLHSQLQTIVGGAASAMIAEELYNMQ